jgi:hypothetical protein
MRRRSPLLCLLHLSFLSPGGRILYVFCLLHFCNVAKVVITHKKILARFGYKWNMEVNEKSKNLYYIYIYTYIIDGCLLKPKTKFLFNILFKKPQKTTFFWIFYIRIRQGKKKKKKKKLQNPGALGGDVLRKVVCLKALVL